MSIYKDGKLIAGGRQCMPLLSFMWADHVLNDASWLRADTFSWQSGAVYQAAYNHLADEAIGETLPTVTTSQGTYVRYSDGDVEDVRYPYCWKRADSTLGYTPTATPAVDSFVYEDPDSPSQTVWYITATGTTISNEYTETIAGVTITYYLADDGHKIVLADQESNVTAIYNATGVAWYYIIDTTNQRFKLPRINPAKEPLIDSATLSPVVWESTVTTMKPCIRSGSGDTLTNGLQVAGSMHGPELGTGYSWTGVADATGGSNTGHTMATDISKSVMDNPSKVYLYFYIGNFTQTALENTAGITAETLNDKLDLDAGNATSSTKQTVGGWCMPDYTTGVSKSWDTSYLADSDTMICYQTNHQSGNPNVTPQVSQDGSTWITLYGQNAGSSNFKIGGWFFCPKGWYWKMVGGRNVDRMLTAYSMKSAT